MKNPRTAPPFYWERPYGWRVGKPYIKPEAGAADVIRFEQEELGNALGIPAFLLEELRKKQIAAQDVVWVCRTRAHAMQYASRERGFPYKVEFGPRALILATDSEDETGYLMLRDASPLDPHIVERFNTYCKEQYALRTLAVCGTGRPYRDSFSREEQEALEQTFESQLLTLLNHPSPVENGTSGHRVRWGSERGLRGLVEDFVLSYLYDHQARVARLEMGLVLSLMEAMVDHLDMRLTLRATERQPLGQLVSDMIFLMIKALHPENIRSGVSRTSQPGVSESVDSREER